MIDKKKNKIVLEKIALKNGTQSDKLILFEFENHDNIFDIIKKIKQKNIFNNKDHGIEFAVGLKLFSEIMLRYRYNPLFDELKPAFGEFMKKLKKIHE